MPMQTILVPIDGSATAGKALDVALDLAEKHGANLSLLHILLHESEPGELAHLADVIEDANLVNKLKAIAQGPKVPRTAEDLMSRPNAPKRPVPDELLHRIGARILENAAARSARRGIPADVLDIADGAPAPVIAAAAKTRSADMIVMGMRGLSQIEAFTFGSVSQQVCRTVQCTCVAVH